MSIVKLNEKNFMNEINNGVTLVDFYADWCSPCKVLAPIIEEVANEEIGAKICKVNINNSEECAKKYSIMTIPTMLIFKDGKVVDRKTGVLEKKEIINWIKIFI